LFYTTVIEYETHEVVFVFSYILSTDELVHCTLKPIIAFGYAKFKAAEFNATAVELATVVVATKLTISPMLNELVVGSLFSINFVPTKVSVIEGTAIG
jgi:hypothetical protein